jgi:4-hydroxybenzoate polyprenyltransferase
MLPCTCKDPKISFSILFFLYEKDMQFLALVRLLCAVQDAQVANTLFFVLYQSLLVSVNDMWDRDFDQRVERTKERPLAAGKLTLRQATVFLAAQLSVGLAVSNETFFPP